jgi:hypothetical protein
MNNRNKKSCEEAIIPCRIVEIDDEYCVRKSEVHMLVTGSIKRLASLIPSRPENFFIERHRDDLCPHPRRWFLHPIFKNKGHLEVWKFQILKPPSWVHAKALYFVDWLGWCVKNIQYTRKL